MPLKVVRLSVLENEEWLTVTGSAWKSGFLFLRMLWISLVVLHSPTLLMRPIVMPRDMC